MTRTMPLRHDQLRSRRIYDYRTMRATFTERHHPAVVAWSAFPSVGAAEAGAPTASDAEAAVYEVSLRIRSPINCDQYHDCWRARIDASEERYPLRAARAYFTSSPTPWLPHVGAGGEVCWGSLPEASTLIAHLVVDLLRMLNFDEDLETLLRSSSRHYNVDSITWWRHRHSARPLNPISYPVVVRVAGDDNDSRPLFGPIRRKRRN